MIKAVLFDLDDTLFDTSSFGEKIRREALAAMIRAGLPARSVDGAYKKLLHIVKSRGSNYGNHFDLLCKAYKVKEPASIVAAGVVTYHELKVSMRPLPGVVSLLLQLIKEGKRIALVTNGAPVKQWDKIHRLRIREYFDTVIVQEPKRTSASKVEAIQKALRKLKVKPKEAIFVGDKLDADIASANKCGVHSVRMLSGTAKTLKPKNKEQTPSYTIKEITEVLRVLGELS